MTQVKPAISLTPADWGHRIKVHGLDGWATLARADLHPDRMELALTDGTTTRTIAVTGTHPVEIQP